MYLAELAVTCINSYGYAHAVRRVKGQAPGMILLEVCAGFRMFSWGMQKLISCSHMWASIKKHLIGHFVYSSP
jgi:hypothetical protein